MKWVSIAETDEVSETINGTRWPVCFGPQPFIARIKERYGKEKINRDVPSSRELLPDKNRILESVCKLYDTTVPEVIKMHRGKMNEAWNVAIYLSRKL
jgi:hypothetical protein